MQFQLHQYEGSYSVDRVAANDAENAASAWTSSDTVPVLDLPTSRPPETSESEPVGDRARALGSKLQLPVLKRHAAGFMHV